MGTQFDTIAAVATPAGRGGIGVVRVSGPAAPEIVRALCGEIPEPRKATLHIIRDAKEHPIDRAIVLYFPEPNSFTGEPVIELQGHGGTVVLDALLQRVVALGARLARPGEFSERAFLNDKIDLVQAEAIADLIEAGSTKAAQAAMRSLQGDFSRRVNELLQKLVQLRVYVEAALDFPEEEVDFLSDAKVSNALEALEGGFRQLMEAAKQGRLLRDGVTVAIAGCPNAGKSSLLNALVGNERAIVTEVPGTTRDVLRESITLDGVPVQLVDMAGLRDTSDTIEREGVRRARDAIETADHVLVVVDDAVGIQSEDQQILASLPTNVTYSFVFNKIDLTERQPGATPDGKSMAISALTRAGLDTFREHLKSKLGLQDETNGEFTARRRHIDALQRGYGHVRDGIRQLQQNRAGELLAEELRQAQRAMNEITGEFDSDDLLGEIFSSFCIGK